jgi:hypothetical protein
MSNSIEYPALKVAADVAAQAAQRVFLFLTRAQLSLLGIIALVSGCAPSDHDHQRVVSILVAVLMAGALLLATVLRVGTFDDRWFQCRALAENIKSAAWFFVMSPAKSVSLAENVFLDEVEQLKHRLEKVAKDVALHHPGSALMTKWMIEIQKLPLDEKLALYRTERLSDQIDWYHTNAQTNIRKERWWFWAIIVIEFIAVVYAALQAWQLWQTNLVGGIAAVGAGFIAWMQTKRFSDLGLSYGIAAEDLRQIEARHAHSTTEVEVEILVKEVEAAVSREHTIWMERRTR